MKKSETEKLIKEKDAEIKFLGDAVTTAHRRTARAIDVLKNVTPRRLRDMADFFDRFDYLTATLGGKGNAGDEVQRSLRRMADGMNELGIWS